MSKYSMSPKSSEKMLETFKAQSPRASILPKILVALFSTSVLIVGGVFAFFSWRESRNEKANVLFAQALKIYQADLLKEGDVVPSAAETPRFKTTSEKAEASLRLLEQLAKEHPNVTMASLYDLLRANILFDLAKWKDAESVYRRAIDAGNLSNLRPFLLEMIGFTLEAQNQREEAMKMYKQEGEKGLPFYKPMFQWDEARLEQLMGNSKRAAEIYGRLLQLTDWSPSLKIHLQNRWMETE